MIGALLNLVFLGGCGTGDYEKLLDKRINDLRTGSKFNILSSPIEVPGTQVSLRVPKKESSNINAFEGQLSGGFESPPLQESASPDGKPYDPRRLKPNVVDLPDLKLTFEGFVEDSKHGKQSYYLYVAVNTRASRGNIPKSMQADLGSKISNATPLTELKGTTPEGGDVIWQMCQATGNQPFYYINPQPGEEGRFAQLRGTIQMLFLEENETMVMLIWRYPAGLDLKNWIELVAGCVKVKPKTPAPGGE